MQGEQNVVAASSLQRGNLRHGKNDVSISFAEVLFIFSRLSSFIISHHSL
jgi:hypothetical protein